MPVHKVKGGYKWGKTGKTYPTKKQAEKQARAIYANGYKGVNENDNNGNIKISKNMNKKNTIKLTESELKKIISESVTKVLKEMDESNEINKLLSQTSDYILKFDASDEARRCAQALENWTEYRESYILDCLNFACRHAYKCLNSDIDENPKDYIQVAFAAREMWRKYMRM